MPGSEIRYGRKYLLFDDPKLQKYYDALFKLGNQFPFDVNNPADLAKIGIIDPAENGEENIFFPLRFDLDRLQRTQKIRNGRMFWYSEEERKEHDKLEKTDPDKWRAEMKQIGEFAAEGYLRYNIRRMMEGRVVVFDEKNKEYPLALHMINETKATLEPIPKEPPKGEPQQPEKPSFYGFYNFFYNLFGWGKNVVEPYRRSMEQYNTAMEEYRKKDTERRVVAEKWPQYATEGKEFPDKAALAAFQMKKLEKAQSASQENLQAVFGEKPAMKPGIKADFAPVIASIDPETGAVPNHGITPEQSAVFTHLAMMNSHAMECFMLDGSIFKGQDHPLIHERDAQCYFASSHLWDMQFGRDGMVLFSKTFPEDGSVVAQGHALAKQAYDKWGGAENDPSLMGKVLADGLSVLTQSLCRNQLGIYTEGYIASMRECDLMYTMLQEHPELKEAAVKQGLSQNTLRNMEANHQVYQQFKKSVEAKEKLFSGKAFSAEETRELLTDAMMLEYINGILTTSYKTTQDEIFEAEYDTLNEHLKETQRKAKKEVEKWSKLADAATDPEEKARLKAKEQEAEAKQIAELSLEGSLFQTRLGIKQFVKPSSEKYYSMGEAGKLEQMRQNVKNSPVVDRYAAMTPETRAEELAKLTVKRDTPEYNRLHLDLSLAVDKKVAAVPAPGQNKGVAAPAQVKAAEKQVGPAPVGST